MDELKNPFLKIANQRSSFAPNNNNSTFFTTPKKCKKTIDSTQQEIIKKTKLRTYTPIINEDNKFNKNKVDYPLIDIYSNMLTYTKEIIYRAECNKILFSYEIKQQISRFFVIDFMYKYNDNQFNCKEFVDYSKVLCIIKDSNKKLCIKDFNYLINFLCNINHIEEFSITSNYKSKLIFNEDSIVYTVELNPNINYKSENYSKTIVISFFINMQKKSIANSQVSVFSFNKEHDTNTPSKEILSSLCIEDYYSLKLINIEIC